jgi:glutamate-ammonia-ligase adenylyltransferase
MLHDFKNAEHLAIGVRDLLGKEDIDQTHAALADVAETCLEHIVQRQHARLVEKYGSPTIGLGPFEGEACRAVILGLGKLGGREPNYHSQLDLLLLYEAEGTTRPSRTSRRIESTTNNHFFTQLGQRIMKLASELTPKGRLYAIDMPLRPLGVGGALAMTLDDLSRHFCEGAAPLWHWQALCQARPVYGPEPAQNAARNLITQLLSQRSWDDAHWNELRRTRFELERNASPDNLKRGPGGTLDVEFLVQGLQLKHAAAHRAVLLPTTQQAITALAAAGALPAAFAEQLGDNYRNLRRVESALRLLNTSARHDLPGERQELAQLAYLLGHSNPDRLREQCHTWMADNRAMFERLTSTAE